MFNAEQFLNTTQTAANATKLDPIPAGVYKAVSQPITRESFDDYDIKNGPRAGTKGYSLNISWKLDDEAAGEYNGRLAFQRCFLDITPDGNGLDMGKGKNIDLGKVREALGQNADGQPWQPSMLGSQVAMINVEQDVDKNDSSKVYSRVKSIAPIG